MRKENEDEKDLFRSCIGHPLVCELCHRYGHCTSHLHLGGPQCLTGAGRYVEPLTPALRMHDDAQHERIITIESYLTHGYASHALKSCLRGDTPSEWIL